MTLISVLLTVAATFTLWSLISLRRNFSAAKSTGLPVVIVTVYELNLPFYILTSTSAFRRVVKMFPSLERLTEYSRQNWRWDVKMSLHQRHGGVFLVVSPGKISMEVADYRVVQQIIANREGFRKPCWMFELVDIYGENVVTTEDAKWKRHRRFTQSAFGERNNLLVWKETMYQAEGLLASWKSPRHWVGDGWEFESAGEDLRTLTLHVISSAGYGLRIPFDGSSPTDKNLDEQPLDPNHPIPSKTRYSYFAAMRSVTRNFIPLLAIRRVWPLSLRSLAPPSIRVLLDSCHDLGIYLQQLITFHRGASAADHSPRGNLIESLARNGSAIGKAGVTDRELLGNSFIFTVAGHETSGAVLEYALLLLASYPEKQRWFCEQLERDLEGQSKDPREWVYQEVFPRLTALMALMNETMRLYPPAIIIPKETADSFQSLTISGRTHTFPSKMLVTINAVGLHYNEDLWGADAGEFRPERWLHSDPDEPIARFHVGAVQGYPDVINPEKGIFLPFSEGVRSCLGKKFAQVEFCVAMAMIMRDHSVEVVGGERGREAARRRLAESQVDPTLKMRGAIELRLRARGV